MLETILVPSILSAIVLGGVLNLAAFHTWLERKQSAVIQDRVGANRASIFGVTLFGLFHPIADMIKMFTKEDYTPPGANRLLFTLAPLLSVFFALAGFAAIPFGNTIEIGGRTVELQAANLNAALLYIFAMASMGVYGVILAGFSSNNNYSFLGGLRASSQILSYEIAMGLTVMGLVIAHGTLNLQEMVRAQGGYLLNGWIPNWGFLIQPAGFFLFLAAGIAETKRIPFDLPEGESEIVGYFVEYSGMKFGMFFLADFIETIMIAALATTLFFGGWQVPWLFSDGFHFPWGADIALSSMTVSILQISSFCLKVFFFCWLFMMIRWTLPRFRYDQLLRLGWKIIFPIALANVFITAVVVLILENWK